MIKIIEHGIERKVTCGKCCCQFSFDKEDIEVKDGIQRKREGIGFSLNPMYDPRHSIDDEAPVCIERVLIKRVTCPECGKKIELDYKTRNPILVETTTNKEVDARMDFWKQQFELEEVEAI